MNFLRFIGLISLSYSKVIEVTDSDIGDYLHRGIPTIVDLYASWCGHCKTFSPIYDELAEKYEHLADEIQFLKIDGDKNRKASARFQVQYFPTIKFIDADENVEEIDERNIHALQRYIKEKVGIIPESVPKSSKKDVVPEEKNAVSEEETDVAPEDESSKNVKIPRDEVEFTPLVLIDDDFEEHIRGRNALVSFTTQWCQYCKAMAPQWDKLARIFKNDDSVVIANVDCSDMELTYSLTEIFGVEGYPTILFFTDDDDEEMPTPYVGARNVESFLDFLHEKGVSNRLADGSLDEKAGIISSLDLSVLPNYSALIEQLKTIPSKYAEVYNRILSKTLENPNYIENELKRVESILSESETLIATVRDKFIIKRNILTSLINGPQETGDHASEEVKDEL